MGRPGVVPPPPWSPPTGLLGTDTQEYSYHFVMFSGEYRQGAERNALLTGLGNLPEALMVVEMSWGERDIYALLRVAQDNEADRRLSDWIDLMAGQRIYNRVQTGWVRYGSEMIRFVR